MVAARPVCRAWLCLPRHAEELLLNAAPNDVDGFTDAVLRAEGLDPVRSCDKTAVHDRCANLARPPNRAEQHGHTSKTQSDAGLTVVIRETTRLWRRHDLGYDQTKYVVEHVRRELALAPPTGRRRSVDRLDRFEVERLIQAAYRTRSRRGLMIKTLFLTGAGQRVCPSSY